MPVWSSAGFGRSAGLAATMDRGTSPAHAAAGLAGAAGLGVGTAVTISDRCCENSASAAGDPDCQAATPASPILSQ